MITFIEPTKFLVDPMQQFSLNEDVRFVIYDNRLADFSLLKVIPKGDSVVIDINEIGNHLDSKFKLQVKRDNKWVDEIKYQYTNQEQKTSNGLKYMFFPRENAKYLVIGFQAINHNPGYNYIKQLSSFPVERLYIKDDYGTDATSTSYYLGENQKFDIAENVLTLIEEIRTNRGFTKEQVICIGSSKGGFASLYFAYKGGYGTVIAGGPQILLGQYLTKGKMDEGDSSFMRDIFNYLMGETTEKNIEKANEILFNVVRNSGYNPQVFIHVGNEEPHYIYHVAEFEEFCRDYGIKNVNIDLGKYSLHSDLAVHYPKFLVKKMDELLKD